GAQLVCSITPSCGLSASAFRSAPFLLMKRKRFSSCLRQTYTSLLLGFPIRLRARLKILLSGTRKTDEIPNTENCSSLHGCDSRCRRCALVNRSGLRREGQEHRHRCRRRVADQDADQASRGYLQREHLV